jgi:protein gp37
MEHLMADQTKIEWTRSEDGTPGATWNPITGCTVVSPGCTNCYAMGLAGTRLKNHESRVGLTDMSRAGPVWNGEVRFNEQWLDQPLRWRKPRNIFVCAHGDLFHPSVPDAWIDRVFAVMALAPHHRFQVLTKRADRMREYLSQGLGPIFRVMRACKKLGHDPDRIEIPLPNVWLGVSVEDQTRADERIPDLLATPAAVRWISAEPLLGPVDLTPHLWGRAEPCEGCPRDADCDCGLYRRHMLGEEPDIAWVVVGGESGRNARPMHPDWARSLRDQCQAAGVAYFFKQWGAWMPWQPASAPTWNAQNGTCEDGNVLFPANMDDAPDWDDGLSHYEPGFTDHCAFQKVGKARAGRLLDGREWNEVPE